MARRRFFVEQVRGGLAELRGEEARHLTRVLRVEAGRQFEISDNSAAWLAEVAEASGERVVFRTLSPLADPAPPVRVTLVAALFKFDRFEWMVEKATELGVERIRPVEAARSDKGLFEASAKRAERWRRIAREASQQSRRLRLPEIAEALPLAQAFETAPGARYFLDEAGAPALVSVLDRLQPQVSLAVGPEGGWTEAERELARHAGWLPAGLGAGILRAETAAVAGLAVVWNAFLA
jgi:16S rRNA (uracil1498-N3)-methyltransferase